MQPAIQGADRAIILIEDNDNDAAITRRALNGLGIGNLVLTFQTAEAAMAYLAPEQPTHPANPALIFLDLNLPGLDGFQFLTWLRRQPDFRQLPLIVMTGSRYSGDIHRAYQLGADSFISKTDDFRQLTRDIQQITDFWLPKSPTLSSIATQPKPPPNPPSVPPTC